MLQHRNSFHTAAFLTILFLGSAVPDLKGQSDIQVPANDSAPHVLTVFEMQAHEAKHRTATRWRSLFVSILSHLLDAASNPATEPPEAPFLGNQTTIANPGGAALMLRQPDCSLQLSYASYQASYGTGAFNVSVQQTIPAYEKVLHNSALLATKADSLSTCADPSLGIYSREAIFGKLAAPNSFLGVSALQGQSNTSGTGPNSIVAAVFDATGNSSNYLSYEADSVPQTMAAGDLNGDGISDFVSANLSSITVFLGKPDGSLQQGVNYDLPSGVLAGTISIDDVTGDGNLDVIVSEAIPASSSCTENCTETSQFAVYPGKGDGTLGSPQITAASGPTKYLVTGDFNGDGAKDIATGIGEIFLNNGTGVFTAVSTLAFAVLSEPDSLSSFQASSVAVGDFNKDGKLDLVAQSLLTGVVTVFQGSGDGTFSLGNSYVTTGKNVAVTDLDNDGNPDIYLGTANGGAFAGVYITDYALMGNGDGTFQGTPFEPFYDYGPQLQQSPSSAVSATTGNIFDLNGDKNLDALVLTANSAGTSFAFSAYLGNGDGTFKAGPSSAVPSTFTVNGSQQTVTGVSSYAIADFNGDGIPDLVYGVVNGNVAPGYMVALGNGDGSFKTSAFVAPNPFGAGAAGVGNGIQGITSADFNHDGKADLIYYDTASGFVNQSSVSISEEIVQLGNGDGTFQPPILVPLSGGTPDALQISGGITTLPDTTPTLIGDVNKDGFPDLFVYQQSGASISENGQTQPAEQIVVYFGKGDGTFQAPTVVSAADNPSVIETPAAAPLLADMNGDGKPDLVSTGMNTNGQQELAISLGNGDGTFQKPTIYVPATYAVTGTGNLTVADFNGDGKQDITFNDGVFLGNGDGTLQVTANSDGTSAPTQLLSLINVGGASSFAGDFNGDGRPDLLNGSNLLLNEYGVTVAGSTSSATTLTVSTNAAVVGQSVTFTAQVAAAPGASDTPTGTVTFYNGPTSLGTGTLASGNAAFTTSSLAAGIYSITAAYGGDSTFTASTSSAVSLTVSAAPITTATTTTLTASSTSVVTGTSLTFSAAVAPASGTGVPTGAVTFSDGGTQLGTGTLDSTGSASYTTSALAAGAHSITAAYGGDTNYTASTSSAVSVVISAAPAEFTIGLAQSSGNVSQGSSVTSTISITPSNGFNQQVTLSCSGVPANTTCNINPSSVTPTGAAATATMRIQTNVKSAALDNLLLPASGSGTPATLAFLGGGGLLSFALLGRRRKQRSYFYAGSALVLLAISALIGCGSSGHDTAKGTYTITVTATAGSDSHTASYSLTIQ